MAKVKDIQPNTVRSLIALWESSISTTPSTAPTSLSARHHKNSSPSQTILDPSQSYPISSVSSSKDSNNVKLSTSERSAGDLQLAAHETDRVDIEKDEVTISDSDNFKRTDSATEISATATTNSPTPDDDMQSVKSFNSESADALSQSNPTNIENLELTKQSEITLSDAQEFICDKVGVPDNDNQEADTLSVMEQQEIVDEVRIINEPPTERVPFDRDPIDDKTICEKHSQESFSTQNLAEETTVCEPSNLKREIARHESFFALQEPKKEEPQEQAQRRQFHQSFIDHVVQLNISQKRLRGLSRWFFHTVNGITIPKQSLGNIWLEYHSTELAKAICLADQSVWNNVGLDIVNGALPTETSTIVSEQFNKIVRSISKSLENPIPTETKVLIVEKVIRVAEKLLRLNNFSAVTAISAALQSPQIEKLKAVWNKVALTEKAALKRLVTITHPQGNFHGIRIRMDECLQKGKPMIPFLVPYLKDLIYGQEAEGLDISTDTCAVVSQFESLKRIPKYRFTVTSRALQSVNWMGE